MFDHLRMADTSMAPEAEKAADPETTIWPETDRLPMPSIVTAPR
jgi:hypothetical protein